MLRKQNTRTWKHLVDDRERVLLHSGGDDGRMFLVFGVDAVAAAARSGRGTQRRTRPVGRSGVRSGRRRGALLVVKLLQRRFDRAHQRRVVVLQAREALALPHNRVDVDVRARETVRVDQLAHVDRLNQDRDLALHHIL